MSDADINLTLAEKALDNHDVPLAKTYIRLAKKYLETVTA